MKIGVIDYGLGNLQSVAGAIEKLGHTPLISHYERELAAADKFILPGVGAFGDGIKNLKERGLIDVLSRWVLEEKKPILGICLGAQLFATESFEFGHHQGLGWINACVKRIEQTGDLRVPHVGWNEVKQSKNSPLFKEIPDGALFYFVHSFHIMCHDSEDVCGVCDYGIELNSVIQHENIFATQFHPEKSQLHGLALLKNFIELN